MEGREGYGPGDHVLCLTLRCTEPVASGPWPRAEQSKARHLEALQKQLQVELKVKQGAENMTHTCAFGTPKVRPSSWGWVEVAHPWPEDR